MKFLEKFILVLLCAVAIIAIAGASDFFTATINQPISLILAVVAAAALNIFRKQATEIFSSPRHLCR
jgi:hypothetical protein